MWPRKVAINNIFKQCALFASLFSKLTQSKVSQGNAIKKFKGIFPEDFYTSLENDEKTVWPVSWKSEPCFEVGMFWEAQRLFLNQRFQNGSVCPLFARLLFLSLRFMRLRVALSWISRWWFLCLASLDSDSALLFAGACTFSCFALRGFLFFFFCPKATAGIKRSIKKRYFKNRCMI